MASPEHTKIVAALRAARIGGGRQPSVEQLRAGMESTGLPAADDVTVTPVDAGGVPAEWLSAPGTTGDAVIVYFHGGGYVMGSLSTHRRYLGELARAAGARVLSVDYRLAPEHPFPAAIHDATAVVRWLVAQGSQPDKLVLAGDSAGGGLALATSLALRDLGDPNPAAAVLISPWTDMEGTGESVQSRADLDPMVAFAGLDQMAGWYIGDGDRRHPLASQIHADLSGLAPLLIMVGDWEVLLDDSVRVAERARAAGVDVTLEVWPEMFHVFPAFCGFLPEGDQGLASIGAFVRRVTATATEAVSQ